MATAHRKIRHKDLKQKDEFFTVVEWSQHFFWTHLTQVLVSAAMVIAVAVLVGAIVAYGRHRSRVARRAAHHLGSGASSMGKA